MTAMQYPRGGSRIFLGGGALISCSTSTPINHIVFFLQNTSCIRKLQVISGGGGVRTPCTLPLDPPLYPEFCLKWMYITRSPTFFKIPKRGSQVLISLKNCKVKLFHFRHKCPIHDLFAFVLVTWNQMFCWISDSKIHENWLEEHR